MYRFIKGSVAGLAAVMLLSTTALAVHPEAYDANDLKCRKTVAKSLGKAIKTGHKTIEKCHKSRNSEKIPGTVDCNLLDVANADQKGKFTKAQDKLTAGLQKSCTDLGVGTDVLVQYISCPEPCTTDLGLANPVTNFGELAQCLNCVAAEVSQDWGTAALGTPTPPLVKPESLCHSTIGKAYGKYLDTIIKTRQKCQDSAEKEGATEFDQTGCATADPKFKIDKALTKSAELMDKKCVGANVAALASCSAIDLTDLKTCNEAEAESTGDLGLADGYVLDATICPASVDTLVQGKTTLNGVSTATTLELGWTGVAFQPSLPDNYLISVDATCPGTEPGSCGDCVIGGVSATGEQYASFTRCSNDFSVQCPTPFVNDGACGGALCEYILGPPLTISSGNNPTCTINRLAVDITGTANPDDGSGVIDLNLSSRVHLGIDLATPCPVCSGDLTPQDGIREGTCVEGPKNGAPCDIQGYDPTFAPSAEGLGLSLDCPPDPLSNITGFGLTIPLQLTTGSSSLGFDNSCDPPLSAFDCACGVCSGATGIPCRNDAECASIAAGTCTAIGGGVPRVPNACGDGICSVDVGDNGICNAGPVDKFCDGEVTAEGEGYISCTSNADCSSVDVVCGNGSPGACGNCTISRTRACFLDPINSTGTPDTENPITVSTFCLPPTTSGAINVVTGSPGPARVTVSQVTNLRY